MSVRLSLETSWAFFTHARTLSLHLAFRPCRTLGPKVEAISSDYPTLIFLSADMEQIIPKLKLRFEVSSLPNTLFLKPDDGVILDQVLGADIDRIKKLCDRWGAGFLGVGGGEQALKSGNCNGGSCAVGGEKGMDEATQFVVKSTISNIEFLEKEGKLDSEYLDDGSLLNFSRPTNSFARPLT